MPESRVEIDRAHEPMFPAGQQAMMQPRTDGQEGQGDEQNKRKDLVPASPSPESECGFHSAQHQDRHTSRRARHSLTACGKPASG